MIVAPAFPARHPLLPCNSDPELFQPGGYGTEWDDQIAAAKAVCADCPALIDCREWAIGTSQRGREAYGIWGATTPDDRTQIRRKRGLPVPRKLEEQEEKAS